MGITIEREVACADMNDSYGVTVWQERRSMDYSTAAARELAKEILAAADEADAESQKDVETAFASQGDSYPYRAAHEDL
jgi:putative aminopeptidase FrvX